MHYVKAKEILTSKNGANLGMHLYRPYEIQPDPAGYGPVPEDQ